MEEPNITSINNSEESCQELAIKGERAIRTNEAPRGIRHLEQALLIGSNDQYLLSALYSQLGNAYFATRDYKQARLYHMSDLNTSRVLDDEIQQAKAYSNLSATYSMLLDFDNAIVCANNVISIGKRHQDESIECRGHYNLGLAHLQCAIAISQEEGQENLDQNLKEQNYLEHAIEEFRKTLDISEQRHDQILCGLALGNIGNAYFYARNYRKAIEYHENRMLIAQELGDKTSLRRTLVNIAKAKILLGEDFHGARENYITALKLAKKINCSAEIIAKLQLELDNIDKMIESLAKEEESNHSCLPKSICDASTSPLNDSFLQRTCKSLNQLDIVGTNKSRRQLQLDELRSDRKSRYDDDIFDMVDRLQSNRLEDQRADFPSDTHIDTKSAINFDIANSSVASSNRRSSISSRFGTMMKRGTFKSFSNIKSLMPSKSRKVEHRIHMKSKASSKMSFDHNEDNDENETTIDSRDTSVGSTTKNSNVSRAMK